MPIRIGVNGGSLEKNLLEKYGSVTADALVESALGHIAILDELNFNDIVVSIKVSNVPKMLEAYRKFNARFSYSSACRSYGGRNSQKRHDKVCCRHRRAAFGGNRRYNKGFIER